MDITMKMNAICRYLSFYVYSYSNDMNTNTANCLGFLHDTFPFFFLSLSISALLSLSLSLSLSLCSPSSSLYRQFLYLMLSVCTLYLMVMIIIIAITHCIMRCFKEVVSRDVIV